ncbi:MAG TPA: amidohydrolase family protein, partial [Terriglobia bacterium]|nr:amidohydrolase family protein [Terriglobia bacterium]
GVRNFAAYTGAGIDEVSRLASWNPARMMGLEKEVGALAAGSPADITVLNAKNEVVEAILQGEAVKQ